MPTAREVPPVDVLLTEDAPSPRNPLGLKGAGEGGVNAVGAAIASAIDDALGRPGAVTRLPVTPARLKALLDTRNHQQSQESRPAAGGGQSNVALAIKLRSARQACISRRVERALKRESRMPPARRRSPLRKHRQLPRAARLARRGQPDGRAAARQRRPLGRRDGRHHPDADREERTAPRPRSCSTTCPGYPKGFRTLYGHFSSIRRVALTLGLPLKQERKVDIVQRYHQRMAEPEDAAAALRQRRADPAERARRRRGRRAEISGAAPPREGQGALHRHRRLRDDAGPRRRLVQSRRLSGAGL